MPPRIDQGWSELDYCMAVPCRADLHGGLMTGDDFNRYCAGLPGTSHVVQWGGADVWKIGGKVFAIGGWNAGETYAVTFKVSELMYEVLRDQPGCRPAPYLASRGMKWIQRCGPGGPEGAELADLIERSYAMIRAKLPKRLGETLVPYKGAI